MYSSLHCSLRCTPLRVTYSQLSPDGGRERGDPALIPSDTYFHHINIIVTCREREDWIALEAQPAPPLGTAGIQIVVQLYKYKTKEAHAIGALISK